MGWYVVGFIDTIIKAFQYGYFILIPLLLIIIFLSIKKKKIKKSTKYDPSQLRRLSTVIRVLLVGVILAVLTSRIWGPPVYASVINLSIGHKESEIEKKLETKYNRNFTFVSKDKISIDPYSGDSLGQDVNNDYSVMYRFKDDDGVIAIVDYSKNYAADYYESKRSKYEIEKRIYDYAQEINFENEFYVFVESRYEKITYSELSEKASSNFILKERDNDTVQFILTSESEKNREFIISALKPLFGSSTYFSVKERVVTLEEYKKVVDFYESSKIKNEIEDPFDNPYFEFDKNEEIYSSFYYIR